MGGCVVNEGGELLRHMTAARARSLQVLPQIIPVLKRADLPAAHQR